MESVAALKSGQNSPRSPKATKGDVGEIDTRAPFNSVKAAVSLFGDVVSPKASTPVTKKSKAEERVLEKETQHQMMLRELDYYKDNLKSAEAAKAQALRDLQRANATLQQLTNKLDALSESKQASIKATEAAKIRVKELEEQISLRAHLGSDAWKVDLENERENYKACAGELTATKQELSDLKQDLEAALAEKLVIFQKAEEAQQTALMNREKESQMKEELAQLRETLEKLKLESIQAQDEHSKIIAEKEARLEDRKSAKEEAEKEIKRLKQGFEVADTLQEKHEETIGAIKVMQEQLKDIKASDLYSIRDVITDLDNAKRTLLEVAVEENSLRDSIEAFKLQLEEVTRERLESEEKALEAESNVEKMKADLEKQKAELDAAVMGCASVMHSSLEKFTAEAEKGRKEAEEIEKNVVLLKQEAESARNAIKEAEEKLEIRLKEAEEAKAAEKLADDRIYKSPRSEDADLKTRKIRLLVEEYEAMKRKIEGFKSEADVKVATVMAQVETINGNEKRNSEKMEAILKESEDIQSQTVEALRSAEMAEAAKRAVESELQKRREKEINEDGKLSNVPAKWASI